MEIGNHGLTCLGPDEYAAIALHMQCQAETIDALLFERQTSLQGLLDRAAITLIPSITVAGTTVNTLFNTVQFDNSPFLSLVTGVNFGTVPGGTGIGIGSPIGATPTVPYLRGWYEFGIYAEGVSTVPVLNSASQATLFVFDPGGNVINYSGDSDVLIDYDDSTGTVRINGSITFELTGTNGVVAYAELANSTGATWQTASSMWVRYIGPSELVEVV